MGALSRFPTVSFRVAALLGLLFSMAATAQQPWRWPSAPRVVVVADVHGAYSELVSLLETTEIVDEQLHWRAGDSRLVSLGDLLDRGAESRRVMDLLMRLQGEAAEAGGGVHVVLGNHELMNLVGDLRYVSNAEFSAFAADEPEAVREAARGRFLSGAVGLDGEGAAAQFEERYPRGYFAHRLAFGLDGRYGKWLLSLPAVIVIGDTAFVHGGLSAVVAETSGDVNERVATSLRRYLEIRRRLSDDGVLPPLDMERDPEAIRNALQALADNPSAGARETVKRLQALVELGEEPALGPDGPSWYRGSVYCNPFLERSLLDDALRRIDALRVVVGHTPTDDRRARALFDGRLVMLDTGMLTEHYAGRPVALLIEDERVEVQYLNPTQRLPLERGRLESAALTEPEIVETLADGAIRASANEQRNGTGRAVQVEQDGRSLPAIFYPNGRTPAGDFELAAHELDRLLGLDLVPPTVARRFDGLQGALQLQYSDAVTEAERLEDNGALAGGCPLEPQVRLMHVFDLLIFNTRRTRDDIVYRAERSVLKLVEHSEAFGTERRLRLDGVELAVSPRLRDALGALDAERLEQAVGHLLDSRQRRALLARRDRILEHSAVD